MRSLIPVLFIVYLFCTRISGQAPIEFSPFEGYAYDLPRKLVRAGLFYNDNITAFDTLARVRFQDINIPETNSENDFPQLEQSVALGLILKGEVMIRKDACYEFSLNSDDGSILWVDDQIILDNDGDHKMLMVVDTVHLQKGTYPTKLWYFQGFPNKYGLVLDYRMLSDTVACKPIFKRTAPEILALESDLYFESGKADITAEVYPKIDEVFQTYSSIDSIIVEGRTDNIGSRADNIILSQNRIKSIVNLLSEMNKTHGIPIVEKALGEDNPLADNSSAEGRAKNRSVVLKIYGRKQ